MINKPSELYHTIANIMHKYDQAQEKIMTRENMRRNVPMAEETVPSSLEDSQAILLKKSIIGDERDQVCPAYPLDIKKDPSGHI